MQSEHFLGQSHPAGVVQHVLFRAPDERGYRRCLEVSDSGPGINNFDMTLFRTFHLKREADPRFALGGVQRAEPHPIGGSPAGIGGTAATGLNLTAQLTPAGALVNNGFWTANSAAAQNHAGLAAI